MSTNIDSSKTWYLCGPMSGRAHFNIPFFDAVAARMRAQGFVVISPGELDSEEIREVALASPDGAPLGARHGSWGDFLSRDVKIVADCVDGLILLPGWFNSRGARLEVFTGLLSNKLFGVYDEFSEYVVAHSSEWVRHVLSQHMP